MSYLDDPVFRSVEDIRAPGAVAQHLAEAWTDWVGEVPEDVAVRAEQTDYEPFEGATLMAEASVLPGSAQGEPVSLGLFLRIYPDAGQLLRAADQARSVGFMPTAGPPFFTIPSCHAAAWTLPSGPHWSGFSRALGQATLSELRRGTDSESTGGCEGLPPWLARYAPLERAEVEDRASHDERYAVKVLEAGDARRIEDNHRLLAQAHDEGLLGFRVPELISSDPERCAVVLSEPRGCVFTSYLREPFREPFAKVGAALASLHGSNIAAPDVQRQVAVVDTAVRAANRIVRALPELGEAVSGVADGLLVGCRPSVVAGYSPIHGRMDAECIVVDGAVIGIRRWDGLAMGHPYQDLAALIAHVIDESVGCRTATSVTRACIRALTESYAEVCGEPLARAELSWHLSRALVVRAGEISLTGLAQGWQDRLIALVGEAQALQSGSSRYLRGC
jgi:hypothetical protein